MPTARRTGDVSELRRGHHGREQIPVVYWDCGFRPGRPRGYRKPVTDDEYRKLLNGEQVLMRGFEDNWGGTYRALVRLKGLQPPQTDRSTGQTVRYGDYQVERQR